MVNLCICASALNCRRRCGRGSFETIGMFQLAAKGLSDSGGVSVSYWERISHLLGRCASCMYWGDRIGFHCRSPTNIQNHQ
jgi:hypothetical protein